MKIVRALQRKDRGRVYLTPEMIQKLDALAESQNEIKTTVADLQKTQISVVKGVTVQLRRLRPSRTAWISAIALLVASIGQIVVAAYSTTELSSQNSKAASIRELAQAYRVEAIGQLIEDGQPTNQLTALGVSKVMNLSGQRLQSLLLQEFKGVVSTDKNVNAELDAADKMILQPTRWKIAGMAGSS